MKVVVLVYLIGGVLIAYSRAVTSRESSINRTEDITNKPYENSKVDFQVEVSEDDTDLLYGKHNLQFEGHLQNNRNDREGVGQGRFLAQYFFPVFPQYHNVDYNDVWNFFKSADTIGYFVFEHTLDVSSNDRQSFILFLSILYMNYFNEELTVWKL